jgi:hypothetical protein
MLAYNPEDDSVLSLFDPLAAPETPPRNISPDSASDKENDGPSHQPGAFTVFFSRTYKDPVAQNVVKTPKGKLIDFGETSRCSQEDDDAMDSAANDVCHDEDTDVLISPSASRRPLADIELEKVSSPTSRIPATIQEESRAKDAVPTVFGAISSAPLGTPLADVINSINLSTMSMQDAPVSQSAAVEFSCPDITVCPPDGDLGAHEPALSPMLGVYTSTPLNAMHLAPTSQPFASSAQPPAGMRRTHTSTITSSSDPRRTSVDLQSSFSLQLQSADMSFDLLNDKISFLNSSNASSSFIHADMDDDTFDFAKEQLEMEEIASRYMQPPALNIEEDTLDIVKEQKRIEATLKKYEAIEEESLTGVVRVMPRVKELSKSSELQLPVHDLTVRFSSAEACALYRTHAGKRCEA